MSTPAAAGISLFPSFRAFDQDQAQAQFSVGSAPGGLVAAHLPALPSAISLPAIAVGSGGRHFPHQTCFYGN
ncbi:hypothetical protein [Herbaspirillum sp. SJZ099]|uniref:hypothetical protein n=1 Tax=Herbaspirillum sp. SJZ099 TaxID=2572916 RepID=UPI0011A08710|nr:hypothetical protein [Herbaspirillum sp. SJZ099]